MTRIAAAVALVVTAALITVAPGITSSKDGRGLDAEFVGANCNAASGNPISLTEDGQNVTSLRPGVYWITMTDSCPTHNFVLNNDPSSTTTGQALTGANVQDVAPTPGTVTLKIQLKHGTYKIFCGNPRHPNMFVDFQVGGVGQVGS